MQWSPLRHLGPSAAQQPSGGKSRGITYARKRHKRCIVSSAPSHAIPTLLGRKGRTSKNKHPKGAYSPPNLCDECWFPVGGGVRIQVTGSWPILKHRIKKKVHPPEAVNVTLGIYYNPGPQAFPSLTRTCFQMERCIFDNLHCQKIIIKKREEKKKVDLLGGIPGTPRSDRIHRVVDPPPLPLHPPCFEPRI